MSILLERYRTKTILCRRPGKDGAAVRAPAEVVNCSAYLNRFLTEDIDTIQEMLGEAILIEKGPGGKLIPLYANPRAHSRYFAGRRYIARPRRKKPRPAGFVSSKKRKAKRPKSVTSN